MESFGGTVRGGWRRTRGLPGGPGGPGRGLERVVCSGRAPVARGLAGRVCVPGWERGEGEEEEEEGVVGVRDPTPPLRRASAERVGLQLGD